MSSLTRIDTALIVAARAGDANALERLLAVSQPDLRRFARRSCASTEDAEDAVQAALWQLHRSIGTLRMVSAFTGWLFRIVERECRRLLGLSRRTVRLDDAVLSQVAVEPVPVGLRRDLGTMIANLPEIYREVLILRDIEEMTAPEAAAQLGISIDAVKSRLHRTHE